MKATNQQLIADRSMHRKIAANTLNAWLASAQNLLDHLGPKGRGSALLLVLLLVAVASVAPLFPRRVTPASAPLDVFSGERAMAHLPVIASEPHPQGSPALAKVRDYLIQELTADGLEVEVQQTAGLQNVVARLSGSDPTGAIVVLTHYDTVSYSPGAGDNSSTVAALLETMRALTAGPTPRNDVIALFHDGEEYPDIYAGTKAFIRKHPWMSDVRVAVSIDSAVAGFISTNEVGPNNNGWLVHALARAYTGGGWMSFSGGGQYNSEPFRQVGIPVIALEDNYPFRQKHTPEDLPEIINAGSVQQMGEQTLSITRVLGSLDLANPWGEQETFFSVPVVGFIHYPEAWSIPLAVISGILLMLALGLALWRRFVSWRGLAITLFATSVTAAFAGIGIDKLRAGVTDLLGWEKAGWEEWPEVIPSHGWLVAAAFGLFVLGLAVASYILVRRWNARADFSMIGFLPFAIAAVLLAFAEPRTAYAFTWPVLTGSLVWIAAAIVGSKQMKWSFDLAATLAVVPLVLMLLEFLPGIVMADGMKSLEILAVIEILLLTAILPVVDGLLVRQPARK